MMSDERAAEFVRNFAGQWLRTRDVTQVSIDPIVVLGHQEEYEKLREQFRGRRRQSFSRTLTPEEAEVRKRFGELREISDRFNDEMKRAMRRETEMCVEYIVQEDRSLLELLDCDYTFVNEKLASLYEIPDVRGSEMRRVKLPEGSPRGGVLTHASMLLVTSNPTRTSPVKRGLFVLENILGMPAPPAPAGVPDLEESAKKFAGREPPLRELLAAHRESALCASCHSRMDPLGIALENFNALGMWRDEEKKQPIDASGKLITGETFQDVRDLKKILRERHASDFYRCVTEKMLTYALGRGLEATDEHTLDLIVRRLAENDGKFSALIQGVIESAPFQKQRNPATLAACPQKPRSNRRHKERTMTKLSRMSEERALALSRRQFLRGVGVSIALPALPSLMTASAELKDDEGRSWTGDDRHRRALRMAFMSIPNGVQQDHWFPTRRLRPQREHVAAGRTQATLSSDRRARP